MSLSCKGTDDVVFHVHIQTKLVNIYVRKINLITNEFNIIKMGKKLQHKDPPGLQLQNGNSGGMNKIFHALNRRHKWQNGQKALPDKRKGSGKHIIEGETTEPTASTSQPVQTSGNQKKNKAQIEQSGPEVGPVTSKASKKFRIRALIADEMSKRRSKGQPRRRSPSPTRSPSKHGKTPTKNSCESPSTMKKRKCNICAAMLTVSYLRQKAQAYEDQKNIEETRAKKQQQASLTKSFSFPILGSTKRKDKEVEELKQKLRECKDKETTKEKFILPMNQWKEALVPKPMLTRPASFRSPSFKSQASTSQKDTNQTTNQSKTLRQKIGRVMKESKEGRESRENRKKEKRRILMDAVFHKIPYGRRNSKDPKKLSPDKIKSNSTTSSTGSNRMAVDQATLKKTASTGEAMTKYRRLLSQTSIRDEKCHHNDHKPRLCVAGDNTSATNERKTLKNIHSLPTISPSDFTQNQEFPVKTQIDTHQSIATSILDDHKSLDPIAISAKVTAPTPAIQNLVKETKLVGKSSSDYQETNNPQDESSAAIETPIKETKLHEEDDAVDGNPGVGLSTSDSSAAIESDVKETKLVDNDEHVDEDIHEKDDQETSATANGIAAEQIELAQKDDAIDNHMGSSGATESEANETDSVEKDEAIKENIDANLDSSDHEEKTDNQKETTDVKDSPKIEVDNDKSFNDILGMFKNVEQKKQDEGNELIAPLGKVAIKVTTDDKDEGDDKIPEVSENTLDDLQEQESLSLNTCLEVEGSIQDSIFESSSLTNIPHSDLLKGISDENQQCLFSIDDQPSTADQPSIDEKRPNNGKSPKMNVARTVNGQIPKNAFLHLDLKSVKHNIDFQFVKEVLERSGFIENEILGEWYSSYQPIDPLLFEEVEASFLQTKNLEELNSMKDADQKIINDHHLLLFDLINEALLEIHKKTCTLCPDPLIYGSKVRPMPVGYRVLEEVWDNVNMYLSWRRDHQPSLDDAVVLRRDLEKGDGWMNLQGDAEFVGIELEEMLTDDLLDELVFDDLLM
ncbi:hypothetical protein LXL04_019303 [Taraxacum kok-saghyz]